MLCTHKHTHTHSTETYAHGNSNSHSNTHTRIHLTQKIDEYTAHTKKAKVKEARTAAGCGGGLLDERGGGEEPEQVVQ